MHNETGNLTKDMVWHVSDRKLVVRNVPYSMVEAEGEETISIGVYAKLELIRKLMLREEIPEDVNFEDVAHLQFTD